MRMSLVIRSVILSLRISLWLSRRKGRRLRMNKDHSLESLRLWLQLTSSLMPFVSFLHNGHEAGLDSGIDDKTFRTLIVSSFHFLADLLGEAYKHGELEESELKDDLENSLFMLMDMDDDDSINHILHEYLQRYGVEEKAANVVDSFLHDLENNNG